MANIQDTNNTYNNLKNAELALARAQLSEDSNRSDILKQKEKLSYDLRNIDGSMTGSSTQIQLTKLQKDLEKAELDYQAKLKSDNQTNENLVTNVRNIQSDLQIILTDTVDETDKLFAITDRYLNDAIYRDIRIYLSAKNLTIKDSAITSFYKLQKVNDTLQNIRSTDIDEGNVLNYLKEYQGIITALSEHFMIMKKVFIDSIEDVRLTTQMAASE